MYTDYITNQDNAELAAEYEAAIPVWYRRLKSMYLPGHGFSFYPPEEGGSRTTDTHYAPLPRYEPGMLVHVCLPDALARVVGGGQVKRFSMDFCEKNELRIPLAAVGSTTPPDGKVTRNSPSDRFGLGQRNTHAQHWAVIVRNMFKEEQIGNPGLLQVVVE